MRFVSVLIIAIFVAAFTPTCSFAGPAPIAAPSDYADLYIPAKATPAPYAFGSVPGVIGQFSVQETSYWSDFVSWNGRLFAGTPIGMVVSDGSSREDGKWSIVPSLYARNVRPIGVARGRLWFEEASGDVSSLAADMKHVVPQAGLGGYCAAVRDDGFWCLAMPGWGHPTVERYSSSSLLQFDAAGKLGQTITTGKQGVPEGDIDWVSVDKNAVWMRVMQMSPVFAPGEVFEGPASPGPTHLVRVDRKSRAVATFDLPQTMWPLITADADHVYWGLLEPKSNAIDAECSLILHVLDKATNAITVISAPGSLRVVRKIVADDGKLWLFGDKTAELALPSLADATDNVDPLPDGAVPPTRDQWGSNLDAFPIASSGATLWVSLPNDRVGALGDNGGFSVTDLSPLAVTPSGFSYGAASGDSAYVVAGPHLVRVTRQGAVAMRTFTGDMSRTYGPSCFTACGNRLFVGIWDDNLPLRTYSSDLSQETLTAVPDKSRMIHETVFAGDSLYAWFWNRVGLYRLDGVTNSFVSVPAWRALFPTDATPGAPGSIWNFEHDISLPYATPTGGVVAQQWSPGQTARGDVRVYDPAAAKAADIGPLPIVDTCRAPWGLLGFQSGELVKYGMNGWDPLCRSPFGDWRPGATYSWPTREEPVLATEKYCYVYTPLGLWRGTWADLTARAKAAAVAR